MKNNMKKTKKWNKNNEESKTSEVRPSAIATMDDVLTENWQMLAYAIIVQAIRDYEVALIKNNKFGKNGLDELQSFFDSDWCDALVSFLLDVNYTCKDNELMNRANELLMINGKNRQKRRIG